MTTRYLVIGELNVDVIVSGLPRLPRLGEEVLCESIETVMGSASAIFACRLAGLGESVSFVGVVGDDAYGTLVVDSLRSAGVDTGHVTVLPGTPTGATYVLTFPEDRAMFTLLGTMSELGPEHVAPGLFGECQHLHVTSPYLLTRLTEHLPALMGTARDAGMTVSLDPQWDPKARWEGLRDRFVPRASIVLVNETEAAAITGTDDVWEAAAVILAWGAGEVVVKRGAAGALALAAGERAEHPGYVVRPVDTTGAGDSFDAGYVKRRVGGGSLASSLAYACAVGALSCLRVGGATEPIGHQEVLRMTGEPQ